MEWEVTYRPARPEDAMGIAIVQVYTWLTTYTGLMPRETIQWRVDSLRQAAEIQGQAIVDGKRFLVAECGNAVVGYAMYGPSRWEAFPHDGEIRALYVLKGMQGLGIGKELFTRCAEDLRRDGYAGMVILCLEGNPCMGFYRSMGGVVTGRREEPVPGGSITEYSIHFKL